MGSKIISGPTKAMLHCSFEYSHSKEHANVEFRYVDEDSGKTKKIKVNIVSLNYLFEEDEYWYDCIAHEARKIKDTGDHRKCRIIYNSEKGAKQRGTIEFIG